MHPTKHNCNDLGKDLLPERIISYLKIKKKYCGFRNRAGRVFISVILVSKYGYNRWFKKRPQINKRGTKTVRNPIGNTRVFFCICYFSFYYR